MRARAKPFALFLLQLLLAGVAPAADARLEAAASHAGTHVESESTDCAIGHDHLFCTLCRALDTGASAPVLPSSSSRDAVQPHVPAHQNHLRPCVLARLAGSPRAPPAA